MLRDNTLQVLQDTECKTRSFEVVNLAPVLEKDLWVQIVLDESGIIRIHVPLQVQTTGRLHSRMIFVTVVQKLASSLNRMSTSSNRIKDC